jgi:hypothetical protein
MSDETKTAIVVLIIILIALVMIPLLMWGLPKYNVWRMELSGQAQLREAEWSKQIQVREAEANLESEILNAKSEIERAKGMAEAIQIEGGALTTEYIQYLWVRQNKFNDKTTIYIPTEANLPILEALRLGK